MLSANMTLPVSPLTQREEPLVSDDPSLASNSSTLAQPWEPADSVLSYLLSDRENHHTVLDSGYAPSTAVSNTLADKPEIELNHAIPDNEHGPRSVGEASCKFHVRKTNIVARGFRKVAIKTKGAIRKPFKALKKQEPCHNCSCTTHGTQNQPETTTGRLPDCGDKHEGEGNKVEKTSLAEKVREVAEKATPFIGVAITLANFLANALFFGFAAVVLGLAVYKIWGTDAISDAIPDSITPSSAKSTKTTSSGYQAPKKPAYTPKGDPQSWSEDDMKKFLSSRNMAVGHASKNELLAMVEAKLHEPTSTGFDDPREWSEEDMKDYLRSNHIDPGHASRTELLAMVESKMHEPKSTGFDDPREWSDSDLKQFLKDNKIDPGHASRTELLAMVESKMHEPK
ncbi:hypothetical protein H2203_008522 [Taxawa tesnikishii (nom. ined.)]|nr:hypothetical protein H2203_008522 [Dothideales sp. JES 119]